jgi:biotin carboxylase
VISTRTSRGTEGTVVIVDPFSTGADLAPQFTRRGWRSVALLSSPRLPDLYVDRVRCADFEHVVVHEANLQATANALGELSPAAVLAGTEIGVELADALAAALGLPGNGTSTTRCRRHKGAMARAVAAAGLSVPACFEAACEADAVEWAESHGGPVVVKPVDSAGGDSVTFCSRASEVGTAIRALLGKVNRMGRVNQTVLVQQQMTGEQYFVNSVSKGGRHRIVEIWADRRQSRPEGTICDREDLLPASGWPQDGLVAFVRGVLDALGIREGPAHTEVMLTPEGFMLIESAARMQGTIAPTAVSAALGENHVTATVATVVDGASFDAASQYELQAHVSVVSLIAPRAGRISAHGARTLLRETATLHTAIGDLQPGTAVNETVDLFTSPGFLYLVCDEAKRIDTEYLRIRELESDGLYM